MQRKPCVQVGRYEVHQVMTTQTEVLNLALEALDGLYMPNELERVNKAIIAIKEYLAQQSNEQVEQRLELIGHADLAINNIYIFSGYGEEVPEGRTPIYAGYKNTHPPVPYVVEPRTAQPKPLTDEQAEQILLDMAAHVEKFSNESATDVQMSGECIRYILERVAAHGIKE